ncbi:MULTISPECIES: ABC transporter permease [Streptomyces]|uniref:ABC transporter permease n=1 Tax=Streptomyces cinereoruber TaxID=67260 RepID=A0AAV4KQ84_9ACTN|nr:MULTISPECIES: ABC transporter permease [Streptomyces]MBB4160133.1 ABC-2 type transport system permease protein [Streptomyces cinereoruber]MBY8818258.1 ABC transporter permease [Streptomyces cinereoruber]NIH61071.1 ABC-2 type transport system permease protein [Streptomyces cinereoruber]PVC65283.1 ABC transporter [Streptomyces sp. CS081A]QEV33225.1 ABC transporter permease [Streptomyces cinereoruber]
MTALTRALRLTFHGGGLSYRALFNWTTPPMFIGTLLVSPLFQIFFFVHVGRNLGVADDRFYLLGNAVLATSVPCVYGGIMAVANERRYGTLGAVLLSPRSRGLIWGGRVLPYVLNGFVVMVFMMGVGSLLLGLSLPASVLLGLAQVFVVAAASCALFGLALGALAVRIRDVFVISNAAFTLLLLFSGANLPAEAMPGWMSAVGSVLPLSHAITALRALFDGASTAEIWTSLGLEAAVALGYAVLAYGLLRFFEWRSRANAALDVM